MDRRQTPDRNLDGCVDETTRSHSRRQRRTMASTAAPDRTGPRLAHVDCFKNRRENDHLGAG